MGNFVADCAGADGDLVCSCFVAAWGVDDEVDLAVLHHVHDVGALLLGELVEAFYGDAFGFEELVGAASRINGEAEVDEFFGDGDGFWLVAVVD